MVNWMVVVPLESSVIGTVGCYASMFNANAKPDIDAATKLCCPRGFIPRLVE